MLFNLEPGSVGYSDKHRIGTIKINDKERRNYSPSHNSPKRVRYGLIVVKVRMPVAYSYDLRKRVMETLEVV
ncbi:MAG: hypothetical protein TV41_04055 [Wolbachia endosymbiont of Dactylopius coccus]|uniref:hypothetical protein n=1 Tax=unclassified Wolbachia TaxID=2640676 RepID=UPI0007D056CC|nr:MULTISPECIES: hypothetical protein [unclassified Wolbachia]OAM06475.1 MAG: hypothetical protein TV41_04055 [Wolbachia endosymbiont of Dactylopius coccus]